MRQRRHSSPQKTATIAARGASPVGTLAALALLAALGILVYSNSFAAPFVLDGELVMRSLSPERFWPWQLDYQGSRPLGMLTLSLNYAVGGEAVWGYHAVNLAIHVVAGWLLYGIVRSTLARPPLAERCGSAARELAFAVAAVWLMHPLATESVTYVFQRLESQAALFYLLTLFCFVRALESERHTLWRVASVVACAAGMATKEVTVSAPLVVLWYDRALVASSWREIARTRWKYYAALAGTWVLLAILMTRPTAQYETSGLLKVAGVTPLDYALSQPGVLVHYLRLCFWPSDLCLDYAWPIAQGWIEIVPPGLIIAVLLAATVWCIFHRPALGFLGGWFFLILAPTSSVAPIKDLAVEHRMYLPSAAVVALVVLGGYRVWARVTEPFDHEHNRAGAGSSRLFAGLLLLLVIGLLGWRTWLRNQDYSSKLAIWQDTLAKSPDNIRAAETLVEVFDQRGQFLDALKLQNHLLELKPNDAKSVHDRGLLFESLGKPDQALVDLGQAIELKPNYRDAYLGRAQVYFALEQFPPAVEDLTKAISIQAAELATDDTRPRLASIYARRGMIHGQHERPRRYDQARSDYDKALELDPDNLLALNARAGLLSTCPDAQFRDGKQALADAIRVCKLTKWNVPEFLETLATANAERGDFERAVQWETIAIRNAGPGAPVAADYRERLSRYQAGKPHREASPPAEPPKLPNNQTPKK